MRRRAVKMIDDVYGTEFLERSKLARIAADFGEEGVPQLLPGGPFTGGRLMGPLAAAFMGKGIGMDDLTSVPGALKIGATALTTALSSPKLSAGLLGGLDTAQKTTGQGIRTAAPAIGQGADAMRLALQRALADKQRNK